MRRLILLSVVWIASGVSLALAQTPSKPASSAVPEAIARKLYELGYPALGRNPEQGLLQWRIRNARSGDGPAAPEEIAAINAAPVPTTYAAFVGHPFKAYGVVSQAKSRLTAEALAVIPCRAQRDKLEGGAAAHSDVVCSGDRALVVVGARCLAVAGYANQVGADGKTYTSYFMASGDGSAAAAAAAMRNCAGDADGVKHCKSVLAQCADQAVPGNAPEAPPEPSTTAIAKKLYILGFPVIGALDYPPTAAIRQWRFRETGKGDNTPLTSAEIERIMLAPTPTAYGAFVGNPHEDYGGATRSPSREHASELAMKKCREGKSTTCTNEIPMIIAAPYCMGLAGFKNAPMPDGKKRTVHVSGFGKDLEQAQRNATANCAREPEDAAHCKPIFAFCADGRQAAATAAPKAPVAPPPPVAPVASPVPTQPVAAPAVPSAPVQRPTAEVIGKLFALGYPTRGKRSDDPAIAVEQWRLQTGRPGGPDLTAEDAASILALPMPKAYLAFSGDPLGVYGTAQRDQRVTAEVDAVAVCRQKRGDCGAAVVVAGDRCVVFVGFKDKTRAFRSTGVGETPAVATERGMKRCAEKPENAALCKPLLTFCADGRN